METIPPLDTLTAVLDDGAVRLGVDVRPEGVTFVAQVRLFERRGPDALPGTAMEQLEGHRGWARDFLERAREQMRPVIQAEACRVIGSLASENGRLRQALAECVSACAPLLRHADEAGCCEGREGDQARAWLALDRAREALAAPALLTPAGPPALPGSR